MQPHQQLWGTDSDLKMIRIDLSAEEMDRINKPDIGIVGDAATVLTALANALPKHNAKRASRKDELDEARAKTMEMLAPLAPQLAYIDAIRNALPEDGVFIDELTQVSYISRLAMPVYNPRSFYPSGYQARSVGGTRPVWAPRSRVLIHPPFNQRRRRVHVQRSGADRWRHQPCRCGLQRRGLWYVQRIQKFSYGNRMIASDLTNPTSQDWQRVSAWRHCKRPHGALQDRIEKPSVDAPVLIEVPVGEMPDPWSSVLNLPRVRGSAKLPPFRICSAIMAEPSGRSARPLRGADSQRQ